MNSDQIKIRDLIELPPIKTVVQLSDLRDPSIQEMLFDSFIVTGEVGKNMDVILKIISQRKGQGIFLEGNFGSGKSHFLTIIASIFENTLQFEKLAQKADFLLDFDKTITKQNLVVLKISLVEHASSEYLEMIISNAAVDAGLIDQEALTLSRKTRFEKILSKILLKEIDGIIILMDELSEFLRSKKDGRAFNEEIRFLQYLGELSIKNPLWIISTLQEKIEDTGEITQETFNKIKDRYPIRLFLGSHHVEELISKRLVKKNDDSRTSQEINRLFSVFKNSFKTFPINQEKFNQIYPVHPETVELLDNLKILFSQHRGVVDFIHFQLAGDKNRGIPGMLDQPSDQLLTPDKIFDHFEVRIKDTVELNLYLEIVFRYFEKHIPQFFEKQDHQEIAFRIIKILILAAISPRKTEFTVQQLGNMLLYRLTDLESEINYRFVAEILEKLYQNGAYLSYQSQNNFLDNIFKIDLEADVKIIVQRKIETVLSNLEEEDQRVYRIILQELNEPHLPLKSFMVQPDNHEEIIWQQTTRIGWRFFINLTELSKERLQEISSGMYDGSEDFLILIAIPFHRSIQKSHFQTQLKPFLAELNILDHTIIWIPSQTDDTYPLKEYYALTVLLEKYQQDYSQTGRKIFEFLNLRQKEEKHKIKEILTGAYINGEILVADYPEKIEQDAFLPFSKRIQLLLDRLLSRLHPKHIEIAPYSPLYSLNRLNETIQRFYRTGSISLDSTESSLRTTIENYLKPLGLLARSGGFFQLRVDPRFSPPVQFILDLLEEEPLEINYLFRRLHRGAYGISREQFNFLLLAVIFSGNAIPFSRHNKIALKNITAYNLNQIERLAKGNILEERVILALKDIPFFEPKLKQGKFTNQIQEQFYEDARNKIKELFEICAFLKNQLRIIQRQPEFFQFPTELYEKDVESIETILDKINLGSNSKEGLQNLVEVLENNPLFNEWYCKLPKITQFFHEFKSPYLKIVNYLEHSDLFIPHSKEYSYLRELQNKIKDLLISKDLVNGDKFQSLLDLFQEFQRNYISCYMEEHQQQRGLESFQWLSQIRNSRTFQLLNHLSTLRKIDGNPSAAEIEDRLRKIQEDVCKKLNIDLLHLQPICYCGFKLGTPKKTEDLSSEILNLIEQGILSYFQQLNESENIQILKDFREKAEAINHKSQTNIIDEFLSLKDKTSFSGWADHQKLKVIKEALEEKLLIYEVDIKDFLGKFLNRTVEFHQMRQLILNWLDKFESDKKEIYIRLTDKEMVTENLISHKISQKSPFIFNLFSNWKEADWKKFLTIAFWFAEHHLPVTKLISHLEKPVEPEAWEDFTKELEILLQSNLLKELGEPEEQLLFSLFNKFYSEIDFDQLREFVSDEKHFYPLLHHALEKAIKIAIHQRPTAKSLDHELIFCETKNTLHKTAHHLLELLPQLFWVLKKIETLSKEDYFHKKAEWWNQEYIKYIYLTPYLLDIIHNYLLLFDLKSLINGIVTEIAKNLKLFNQNFQSMFPVLYSEILENKKSPISVVNLFPLVLKDYPIEKTTFVLIDGLRWDMFQKVKQQILSGLFPTIKTVWEHSVWTILPSTTEKVIEKITDSLGLLNLNELAEESKGNFNGKISSNIEISSKIKIHKINAVDTKIHTSRDDLLVFGREILFQIKAELEHLFYKTPLHHFILLFSDHGFTTNPDFNITQKYHHPRYKHGNGTPFEIIVPAIILQKTEN